MKNTLKEHWIKLTERYSQDKSQIETCFDFIWQQYNESHRHYHNIEHIRSMVTEIEQSPDTLIDKDAVLFATWFHDIIYNPKAKDNEAKSAEVAIKELKRLSVPVEKIQQVKKLILATASHMNVQNPDSDLSFFLDCDLKILGDEKDKYLSYANNIRSEYKHVISFIYKRERKKILQQFINSPCIYRTDYFRDKYEKSARTNILFEIQNL